ncbi:17024_t:CDS:2, partial [Gigaspora rosea]
IIAKAMSSGDDDFSLQVLRTQQSEILATNDIKDDVFINFNTSKISEHKFENEERLEIIPALAWISNKFTAGVQSTQRVKGMNAIIKSNVTSKTSLSELANVLDTLWYNAILVSRENVNVINLMKQKSENDFYENLEDFPATNNEEIISNLSAPTSRNLGNYSRAISTFNFMLDLNLMHQNSNIPYNVSKVLKSRHAYRVTNSLCKKAMSVGLNAGPIAMETLNKLLKNFIHKNSLNSNRYLLDNIVSNNREIQENKSYDLEESSEENLKENQENIDPSTVRDPIIKKRKGAPRVKCIKSSFEATNTQSNVIQEKAKRLCSHCKQPNHYAKTCTVDF